MTGQTSSERVIVAAGGHRVEPATVSLVPRAPPMDRSPRTPARRNGLRASAERRATPSSPPPRPSLRRSGTPPCLHEAPFGVVDQHLASIRDLVDDGRIEVLGYDARVVVRSIAVQGPSEGRFGWIIGFALTMSGKEGLAGSMWSVVLVPNLSLDAVLDQIR